MKTSARSRRRALPFAPAAKQPLALQVADQLRQRILLHEWRAGQRLPAEAALAEAMGVSLPTAVAGITALTFAGLLEARHGVGVFVAKAARETSALELSMRRATFRELHSLRSEIEMAAMQTAATRRTDRQLTYLSFAASELLRALMSEHPEAIADTDLDFHRLLVAAARNPLISSTHRAICIRLRPELVARAGLLHRDGPHYAGHAAVLDALESGKPRRVSTALSGLLALEAQG